MRTGLMIAETGIQTIDILTDFDCIYDMDTYLAGKKAWQKKPLRYGLVCYVNTAEDTSFNKFASILCNALGAATRAEMCHDVIFARENGDLTEDDAKLIMATLKSAMPLAARACA